MTWYLFILLQVCVFILCLFTSSIPCHPHHLVFPCSNPLPCLCFPLYISYLYTHTIVRCKVQYVWVRWWHGISSPSSCPVRLSPPPLSRLLSIFSTILSVHCLPHLHPSPSLTHPHALYCPFPSQSVSLHLYLLSLWYLTLLLTSSILCPSPSNCLSML